MLDHATYRSRRYFAELDGIRAVSVLLVFTAHLSYPHFWPSLHGGAGVSIFFVLSGYLITTLSLREERRRGALDLAGFYIRRVFRIYPLYFAVLGLYVTLVLGLGMQPDRRQVFVENLPYYVFFFPEHNRLEISEGLPSAPFTGAWSIGIEEKFYLVWPVLGFVLLAGRLRARLAVLAVSGVVFAALGAALGSVGEILQPYALLAIGCTVAILLDDARWFGRLRLLGHPVALAASASVMIALHLGTGTILTSLYVPYGVVIAAVLVGVLITTSRGVTWLTWRPMVLLGKVSYAFYLTHNFAVNAVESLLPQPQGPGWALVAASMALALAVGTAWVLHVAVEKPMIRLGHQLAHRRAARRGRADEAGFPSLVSPGLAAPVASSAL